MVERLLYTQKVGGSRPSPPTNKIKGLDSIQNIPCRLLGNSRGNRKSCAPERYDLDLYDVQDALGLIWRQRFEAGAETSPVHQGFTLEIAGVFCAARACVHAERRGAGLLLGAPERRDLGRHDAPNMLGPVRRQRFVTR